MKPHVVVMGVSGSGKSTIGEALAARLGVGFLDADDLHPAANRDKMHRGIPLTDADRMPWLGAVGDRLAAAGEAGLVVACSALRRRYRDALRDRDPQLVCAHLSGSREVLASRLAARSHAFMPAALLDSQLATLEPLAPDEAGFTVRITAAPAAEVDEIVAALAARERGRG